MIVTVSACVCVTGAAAPDATAEHVPGGSAADGTDAEATPRDNRGDGTPQGTVGQHQEPWSISSPSQQTPFPVPIGQASVPLTTTKSTTSHPRGSFPQCGAHVTCNFAISATEDTCAINVASKGRRGD